MINGRPYVRLKVRDITESDQKLIDGWRDKEMLFEAPRGICDDWYLLVASLATHNEVCGVLATHQTSR
jgi:hypothetical protein